MSATPQAAAGLSTSGSTFSAGSCRTNRCPVQSAAACASTSVFGAVTAVVTCGVLTVTFRRVGTGWVCLSRVGVSVTNAASNVSLFDSRCPEKQKTLQGTDKEQMQANRSDSCPTFYVASFWLASCPEKCPLSSWQSLEMRAGCVGNSGHLTPDNPECPYRFPRTSVIKSRAGGGPV